MNTWNDTPEPAPRVMLPVGTNEFGITLAKLGTNAATGRSEAIIGLANDVGEGRATIPLESWGDDNKFGIVFKAQASALGYQPGRPDMSISDAALDFGRHYLPTLLGQFVEARVEHSPSDKLKDDGTPFINQHVYFNALTSVLATA